MTTMGKYIHLKILFDILLIKVAVTSTIKNTIRAVLAFFYYYGHFCLSQTYTFVPFAANSLLH